MRWHAHFGTSGSGHLYQGRFKSFPVEADEHLYCLLRYVERNAKRANLVSRAEQWRWSSLWRRVHGDPIEKALLHRWPVAEPADWRQHVNRAQSEAELKAVRHAIRRGAPLGSERWQLRTAAKLGLEWTLRARGRPRRQSKD